MLSMIYKVCPGSQHLFNTNILSVHLKNLFMRMECLLLEYLHCCSPVPTSPVCCSGGSHPVPVPTLCRTHPSLGWLAPLLSCATCWGLLLKPPGSL